jgi:hypothetical protein
MHFKHTLTLAGLAVAAVSMGQANLAFQQTWRTGVSADSSRPFVSARQTGGAYVATGVASNALRQTWLAAYSDGGTLLWSRDPAGWSVSGLETAFNGDALVLLGNGAQVQVRRYSPDGVLRWTSQSFNSDRSARFKPFRDGRVALITRSLDASNLFSLGAENGAVTWNVSSPLHRFLNVATDEQNRTYVTTWTARSSTTGSYGARRYSPLGAVAGEFLDAAVGSGAEPGQMFVNGEGNLFFAGAFSLGLRYFRLNPEFAWFNGSTSPLASRTTVSHLLVGPRGAVYVSAFRETAEGGREALFVGTATGAGVELRGSVPASGPAANLVLMPGNDLYSTNSAPATTGQSQSLLRRWSAAGTWISDLPLGNGQTNKPAGLARHLNGDLYVHALRLEDVWSNRVSRFAPTPLATSDNYVLPSTGALTVESPAKGVLANDVYGLGATAVLATQPAHGTVTLNPNGTFTYVPQAGFMGNDTFTYRAQRLVQSAAATVTVSVSQRLTEVTGDSLLPSGRTFKMNARLAGPATAALNVTLAYTGPVSGPAAATAQVGSALASFSVCAGTVASPTAATITATYQGSCVVKNVTVRPILIASFTPSAILECGAEGRWELKMDAAVGDACPVTFESSNALVLPAPASASIPANSTTAVGSFRVRYVAVDTNVSLRARVNGVTREASVTVKAFRVRELGLSSAAVKGGESVTLRIRLSAPAVEAKVVNLRSNSSAALLPATVTVAAGQSFVEVTVRTTVVPRTLPATLTASVNNLPTSVNLTINP